MFQAIQIETQSKQQSLTLLRAQRAARCTGRELAFDRTEQALDQRSAPVEPSWKCAPHLGAYPMDAPGFLSTLGQDHTLRPGLLPDMGMISLVVEFGVSHHHFDACSLGSCSGERLIRAIIPRTLPRELRKRKLLIQIHGDDPLQPVPLGRRFLPVMHALHKERANRSLRQARRIDRRSAWLHNSRRLLSRREYHEATCSPYSNSAASSFCRNSYNSVIY